MCRDPREHGENRRKTDKSLCVLRVLSGELCIFLVPWCLCVLVVKTRLEGAMNPVELRVLALYQRLWRENRLLLGLLRDGCALAQAERILAESGSRLAPFGLCPNAPAGRASRQGARRIVV